VEDSLGLVRECGQRIGLVDRSNGQIVLRGRRLEVGESRSDATLLEKL
jgi:hypothetical protein